MAYEVVPGLGAGSLLEPQRPHVFTVDGATYPYASSYDERLNIPNHLQGLGSGALLHSAEGQERILQLYKDFLEAGALVLTTASWNLEPNLQATAGVSAEEVERLAELSVALAHIAIDQVFGPDSSEGSNIRILASLRPPGDCYTGEGLPPDTKDGNEAIGRFFDASIAGLRSGIVNGERGGTLWLETSNATHVVKKFFEKADEVDLPAGSSICPAPDGKTVRCDRRSLLARKMGAIFPPSKKSLKTYVETSQGRAGMGIICEQAEVVDETFVRLAQLIEGSNQPVLLCPQAHNPRTEYDSDAPSSGDERREETLAKCLEYADRWIAIATQYRLGNLGIGLCCGGTPDDIAALNQRIQAHNTKTHELGLAA